jgi:dCMP deaminase
MSWTEFYLGLCDYVASKSKDPSTKCGAVIVRPNWSVAALGFNGFPRGCNDYDAFYENRETKLARTVHAELNAIFSARENLDGYTIFSNRFPCSQCAAAIIQTGIMRVIYRVNEEFEARWVENLDHARRLFAEAGVLVSGRIV